MILELIDFVAFLIFLLYLICTLIFFSWLELTNNITKELIEAIYTFNKHLFDNGSYNEGIRYSIIPDFDDILYGSLKSFTTPEKYIMRNERLKEVLIWYRSEDNVE